MNQEQINVWISQQQRVMPLVKPAHSYIGLIAQAILESSNKRLLLSELYEWILTRYPYFRFKGNGWRNSVRHNLSLNDCFIKTGRAPNGKSSYWTIHPANFDDFARGDFRRKQAQWKVKSHDVRAFAGHLTSFPCMWPLDVPQMQPQAFRQMQPLFGVGAGQNKDSSADVQGNLVKKQKFNVESLID